jgi:hypothetical protein
MPITKRCGDCGADITSDLLTHDCPQRRARLVEATAREAAFIRRVRLILLLIAIAGLLLWGAIGYGLWKTR